MKKCIYETYCGLCDVLIAYKTDHKSEFASFWTEPTLKAEPTLEAFLKTRGINNEKNNLQMKCNNFQDKIAIIGSYE
jgi:hypothetical protein